jgi:hypothetical protein
MTLGDVLCGGGARPSNSEVRSLPLPILGDMSLAAAGRFYYWPYCNSLVIASTALPATTQLTDPATTASSSNQRNPKSSMHSGKSGLMMMYPGITALGMYALSARLLLCVFVFQTVPTPATYETLRPKTRGKIRWSGRNRRFEIAFIRAGYRRPDFCRALWDTGGKNGVYETRVISGAERSSIFAAVSPRNTTGGASAPGRFRKLRQDAVIACSQSLSSLW